MHHSHSSVELLVASPAHSPQKRTTTPGSDSRRSPSSYRSNGPRRGSGRGLYPLEGARLWAWVLLWALVAPGACSLTADQEELIVELHNFYRGKVFPPATAMMPLKWDSNIQVLAGSYVAKCSWQHNPELVDTGENLFVTEGPLDIRIALDQWFMEINDYNYDNNSCPEDKMCGHYTQMVWSDSHRVGCEVHSCAAMEGLDLGPSQFLVCNYYPAGNYEDQRPYEEGEWCSRCPEVLKKCENYLCVPDVEVEDDEDTTILPSDTTQPSIGSSSTWTEAPPPTPSQNTPPASHPSPEEVNIPAPTAGGEGETGEEEQKEEEQKEGEQKEEPKQEKEEEQKEGEQKEEPKQEKEKETKMGTKRGSSIQAGATSCCPYDSFLLLCLVGALALRL